MLISKRKIAIFFGLFKSRHFLLLNLTKIPKIWAKFPESLPQFKKDSLTLWQNLSKNFESSLKTPQNWSFKWFLNFAPFEIRHTLWLCYFYFIWQSSDSLTTFSPCWFQCFIFPETFIFLKTFTDLGKLNFERLSSAMIWKAIKSIHPRASFHLLRQPPCIKFFVGSRKKGGKTCFVEVSRGSFLR